MSILDQWQDRWRFAVYNNEQRFQTKLVTKRQFWTNLVGLPLQQWQNKILRPDIEQKGFNAATFKFIDDVFISTGGGQVTRSFLFAYANDRDFRMVHNTARALEGLGMVADALDKSDRSIAEEIAEGQHDVMYGLVTESAAASDMLDQFVHGKLEASPSNIAKLEQHLHALAKVCEEKAALMQGFQGLRRSVSPEAVEKARASDYIRDVIEADRIKTPRQAQILSGFIAALLVDVAAPLGTEMFVPQDERYMDTDAAVAFAKFVEQQLEHHGFSANIVLDGAKERPVPDLPEGAMIKATRDAAGNVTGHAPVNEVELMAFANAMHRYLKKEIGVEVDKLLSFADREFDQVEEAIARPKLPKEPELFPVFGGLGADRSPQADEQHPLLSLPWEQEKSSLGARLKQIPRAPLVAARHLTRPEARFEVSKLWGRNIAGQLLSFPMNVLDEVLKDFMRPGKGFDKALEGITGRAAPVADQRAQISFENNVKSRTLRLITQPFIASYGQVYAQELYELPKALAIDATRTADRFLTGAIRSGHRQQPQVAARLAAMEGPHPAVEALLENPRYREEIPRITKMSAEERSAEDYLLMAEYFRELSDITVSMAEEAFSPFGVSVSPEKIEGMDDVVTRVLRRPVTNPADAMVALAFIQTFLAVSMKKHASMEFIDPHQLLIKHQDMHRFSAFVEAQAKAAGLVVATGTEGDEIAPGELLEKDPKSGKMASASGETLMRFANVLTSEMKQYVHLDTLLFAAKGKVQKEYIEGVEASLFKDTRIAGKSTPEEHPATVRSQVVSDELTAPWQGKVKRPKTKILKNIQDTYHEDEVQHEVKKLLGRSRGQTITSAITSLFHNSLLNGESAFSRQSLFSSAWKTVTYPVLYSKGLVAVKETINEVVHKKRRIVNEADVSGQLMAGAMLSAGALDPEMSERLQEICRVESNTLQLQDKIEFRDIPRIASKPRDQRTEQDNALMQRFCEEMGDHMVSTTGKIFTSLAGASSSGESVESVITRALSQPVNTLGEAVLVIGFLQSVTEKQSHLLQVMRYTDPADRVLERKQVESLTSYINEQAAKAGFALHGVPIQGKNGSEFRLLGQDANLKEGELLQWDEASQNYHRASPENVIRFANVITAKFRELAREHVNDPELAKGLAARYQQSTKSEVFTRL